MSSKDEVDQSETEAGVTGAAAGLLAGAAATGVASAASGVLFDPTAADVRDTTTYLLADGASVREITDATDVSAGDVRSAWTEEGASTAAVLSDVADQTRLPLSDARRVLSAGGVSAADVDRLAVVDASEVPAPDRVTGAVATGSFDTGAVIDGLRDVATVESIESDGEYDRYSVTHSGLAAVVAAGDGELVVGRSGAGENGGVVDRVAGAETGLADRDPQTAAVLDAVGDAPIVGGAAWRFGADASAFLPAYVETTAAADRYLPDGVSLSALTDGIGAAAVGVEPSANRVSLALGYEGTAPVAEIRSVLSHLDEEIGVFEGVTWSVRDGDAVELTLEVTDERLASAEETVASETLSGRLRERALFGFLPTVESGVRVLGGRLAGFVERNG